MVENKKNLHKNFKGVIFLFLPLFTVVFGVLLWWIVAKIVNLESIFPSPKEVFKNFFICFTKLQLYKAVLFTLLRALLTFVLAVVFGFLTCYASSKSEVFKRCFSPILALLKSIPTMSVILLFLLWLNEDFVPVAVAFLILFPLSYEGFNSAFLSIDDKKIEMLKVFGVSKKQSNKFYVMPTVFTSVLPTLKVWFSLAFKVVISAEVMAEVGSGIGKLMKLAKADFDAVSLFAYTLFALLICALVELLISIIVKEKIHDRN